MVGSLAAVPLLYTGSQWTVILIILAVGLALKAWVLWWLYQDTTWRGVSPWPWVGAAVVFDVPTLMVWLVRRPAPPQLRRTTPKRRAPVAEPAVADEPADPDPAEDRWRAPAYGAEEAAPGSSPEGAFTTTTGDQEHADVREGPGLLARVTCPRCENRFMVRRAASGPTGVTCERCGAAGRIR